MYVCCGKFEKYPVFSYTAQVACSISMLTLWLVRTFVFQARLLFHHLTTALSHLGAKGLIVLARRILEMVLVHSKEPLSPSSSDILRR